MQKLHSSGLLCRPCSAVIQDRFGNLSLRYILTGKKLGQGGESTLQNIGELNFAHVGVNTWVVCVQMTPNAVIVVISS